MTLAALMACFSGEKLERPAQLVEPPQVARVDTVKKIDRSLGIREPLTPEVARQLVFRMLI